MLKFVLPAFITLSSSAYKKEEGQWKIHMLLLAAESDNGQKVIFI